MLDHKETKSRQVHGSMGKGEGEVPPVEQTPSCQATMYGEMNRGIKFDDSLKDVTKEGRMPEEHTSKDH